MQVGFLEAGSTLQGGASGLQGGVRNNGTRTVRPKNSEKKIGNFGGESDTVEERERETEREFMAGEHDYLLEDERKDEGKEKDEDDEMECGICMEDEEEEGQLAKTKPNPTRPSEEEMELHIKTHILYRSW